MQLSGFIRAAVILGAVGLATGCSHVQVAGPTHLHGQALSAEGRTVAHLNASSWGIYLLNVIPIVSGSRERPGHFSLFRNTATVKDTVALLTKKAAELGADRTVDLQSFTDSWWQGWSLFFWLRAAYASGNAVASGPPVPPVPPEPAGDGKSDP